LQKLLISQKAVYFVVRVAAT